MMEGLKMTQRSLAQATNRWDILSILLKKMNEIGHASYWPSVQCLPHPSLSISPKHTETGKQGTDGAEPQPSPSIPERKHTHGYQRESMGEGIN